MTDTAGAVAGPRSNNGLVARCNWVLMGGGGGLRTGSGGGVGSAEETSVVAAAGSVVFLGASGGAVTLEASMSFVMVKGRGDRDPLVECSSLSRLIAPIWPYSTLLDIYGRFLLTCCRMYGLVLCIG